MDAEPPAADAAEAEQSAAAGFSAGHTPQLLYSVHAEFAASASKCSAAARRRVARNCVRAAHAQRSCNHVLRAASRDVSR
jgi:hypothetical protein